MGERSSHSQTVEGLYPLKDEGGCGRSQLALECHNEQGYQEAEQRSNEVERQGEPLVTGVQRIESSAKSASWVSSDDDYIMPQASGWLHMHAEVTISFVAPLSLGFVTGIWWSAIHGV